MSRPGRARARVVGGLEAVVASTPLRLGGFLALAAWYFAAPLAAAHRIGASFDHRFYYALAEITRKLLVEQRTVPLWNPYFCGGIPHLANPTVALLVPTLPLVLVFGAAVGQKLTVVAMLVVGLEGCHRLARALGADALSALLAGPVFALSGEMTAWLATGQDFLGVLLIPWVLCMTVRAHGGDRRAVAWGALVLAWMLGTVPAYPVLWCALVVGLWALLEAVGRARRGEGRAALGALGPPVAMALLGSALLGVRLLPLIEIFLQTPRRVVAELETTSPGGLLELLVYEGGVARVGLVALGLALLGLGVAGRWRVRLGVLLVVFALLALGSGGGLWELLCRLPLYRNLRYALRFGALVALVVGLLASLAVARLRAAGDAWRPGLGTVAALVALVAVGVDLLPAERRTLGQPYVVDEVRAVHQPFAQARGNHWLNQVWPRIDRGSIACYEETPFHTSAAVRGDLPAEERLAEPAAGSVRRLRWSGSVIVLAVDLRRPARLLINQNHAPGWRSSVGRVVSQGGALAVDLPAGRRRVTLRYRPTSVWLGAGLSLLGGGVWVLVWRRVSAGAR